MSLPLKSEFLKNKVANAAIREWKLNPVLDIPYNLEIGHKVWQGKPLTNFSQIILLRTLLNNTKLVKDCCLFYILSKSALTPSKCWSFLLNPVFHVVAVEYSHLIANKSLAVLFGKLSHRTVNTSCKRTMGNSVSSENRQLPMAHLLIEAVATAKETLEFMLTLANIGIILSFLCFQTTWVTSHFCCNLWSPSTKNTWW